MWRTIGELRKFAAENGSAAVAKRAAESVERIAKLGSVQQSPVSHESTVLGFSVFQAFSGFSKVCPGFGPGFRSSITMGKWHFVMHA